MPRFPLVAVCLEVVLLSGACTVGTRVSTGDAQAGALIYEHYCSTCHTIGGGRRIGPDLLAVHQRRERRWLVRFIDDPVAMNQNDPIARQLLQEYGGRSMADAGLERQQIEDVLAYIVELSQRLDAERARRPAAADPSGDL